MCMFKKNYLYLYVLISGVPMYIVRFKKNHCKNVYRISPSVYIYMFLYVYICWVSIAKYVEEYKTNCHFF